MKALFEWGLQGANALLTKADAFVVVDVLSFSTCVDVVTARGAAVIPFPLGDRTAAARQAEEMGAILAGRRRDINAPFSLSPASLADIPAGKRLILPSPNGSCISFAIKGKPVIAGCLRNASAVAAALDRRFPDGTVAVIAAGEHWPDDSYRPAIEDLVGAGAILAALDAELSSEARVARATFDAARSTLDATIRLSVSGTELTDIGFPQDVDFAVAYDESQTVPLLDAGIYRDSSQD